MEFASLQDAFPQVESSKEKRRSKKKEGFQAYELPPTDPDRPAMKRMLEVPPVGKGKINLIGFWMSLNHLLNDKS